MINNETKSVMSKHDIYAAQKVKLKRAVTSGFFYEAILIEYAMLEDRTESALRHAGVKTVNSKGYPLMLNEKLNKIKSDARFSDPFIKKRLTDELLELVREWKRKRDALTHALMKHPPDNEAAETVALEGAGLVRKLENKVRSVNDHRDKQAK